MRLTILYILYRGGILGGDIQKLLAHAQLSQRDGETIFNLSFLGARVQKPLRDSMPPPPTLFPVKPPMTPQIEEVSLSRFEPALRSMLEDQIRGTLDPSIFPPVKPHLDGANGLIGQDNVSQSSLRTASKPTWARTRPTSHEPRQRIIVFTAGGATYAEARTCYEMSQTFSKDVFLATSHMLTPQLFLRQVADLSIDKRQLDIPAERPPPRAPAHVFERESPPQSRTQQNPMATVKPSGVEKGPAGVNAVYPGGKPDKVTMSTNESHPQSSKADSEEKSGKHKKDEKERKKIKHFFHHKS